MLLLAFANVFCSPWLKCTSLLVLPKSSVKFLKACTREWLHHINRWRSISVLIQRSMPWMNSSEILKHSLMALWYAFLYSHKVRLFLAMWAHKVVLISIFIALSQIPAYTRKPQPVLCIVCLFTSQFLIVLIVSTHRGMAGLSWLGRCLYTEVIYAPTYGCWSLFAY